jgi:FG-GAP-like repeat
VEVYNGLTLLTTPTLIGGKPIMAFESTWHGGVTVAVGDLNNDGYADIAVGRGAGGAPEVKIYTGNGLTQVNDFPAFPSTFHGGVNLAIGDFNGDGQNDLIVSAGPGWQPWVYVYNGNTMFNAAVLPVTIDTFLAYAKTYTGGVRIAAIPVVGGHPSFIETVGIWFTPMGTFSTGLSVTQAVYVGLNLNPTFLTEMPITGTYTNGVFIG